MFSNSLTHINSVGVKSLRATYEQIFTKYFIVSIICISLSLISDAAFAAIAPTDIGDAGVNTRTAQAFQGAIHALQALEGPAGRVITIVSTIIGLVGLATKFHMGIVAGMFGTAVTTSAAPAVLRGVQSAIF